MSGTNMSQRPKVLVTNPFTPQIGLDLLNEKCDLIICEGNPPSKEEIMQKVKNVDAIYWCSLHKLDQLVVDAAGPNLKVVSTFSDGYDNIDVKLLKKRQIRIGNTTNVLNDSVAEVAVALALMVAHRLQEGYTKIMNNEWVCGTNNPRWLIGHQLTGSVIGIVGLGRVGSEIAARLKPFKIKKLLYTGHSEKDEGKALGAEFVSMNDLLQNSDFIIISCPLNDETRHLFCRESFKKMKSDAILINVGRGDLIDQKALVEALARNKIGGAGLDVTTPEPLPQGHPLLKLHNCVLSPHLGSATYQTRNAMAGLTAVNILCALEGKTMPSEVLN
ncbi:glyoxylate reductase/hydroxypyruvate reductase-like isoform X2 [Lycorma delicatula]